MNAYTLAALPPALLVIAEPTLWVYALVVALFVAAASFAAAAHHFRAERDEAREDIARLQAENAELAHSEAIWRDQNERMRAALTEERLIDPTTATTVPVPLLRAGKGLLSVVPPVADEDDYWARLMKATEER